MRFLDINQKEFYLILVLFIEAVESGNLPPKRRSGIAAEDQHDRLLSTQRGKLDGILIVKLLKRKVWRHVANFYFASSSI